MTKPLYQTDFMNDFEDDKEIVSSFLEESDSYRTAIENASSENEVMELAKVVDDVLSLPKKWASQGCLGYASILRETLGNSYSLTDTISKKINSFPKKRKLRIKSASEVLAGVESPTLEDEIETDFEEQTLETNESIEEKVEPTPKMVTPQMRIVKPEPKEIITPENVQAYSTFPDVVKYFESNGIVGEKELFVLMALCVVAGESFGVEGDSGSGKSFITDPLINLFPEDMKYVLGLMSETAIFRLHEKVNSSWIKYMPELQKVLTKKSNNPTLEYAKNFGEGKETTRTVSKPGGDGVIDFTLNAEGMLIYTLARQNAFKKDVELGRRMLVLYTDDSSEHKQERLDYEAAKRCGDIKDPKFGKNRREQLTQSLIAAMAIKTKINDAFANYSKDFIPKDFSTGISYSKHIYALEDACCKFNAENRIEHDEKLQTAIEDKYIVGEFYLPHFYRAMMEICEDPKQKEDIQARIEMKQDWQKCWDMGVAKMKEKNPEIADEWIENQAKDGVIAVYNPAKKETIELARCS